METLKFYIKKFWVLFPIFILSLFLFTIGIIRTNRGIILKGDTVAFTSVVDINTENEQKGSFSTIYVYSVDKSTILQNWIVEGVKDAESYLMGESTTHINDFESYQAGKIQYNSSIGNALILAYSEASKEDPSIHLEYKFVGYDVTYYGPKSSFKIGDRIIGIYSKEYGSLVKVTADIEEFNKVLRGMERKDGDYYLVKRNNNEIEIPFIKGVNNFEAYGINEWSEIHSNPTFSVASNTIGGPSGGLLQSLSIYNQLVSEDLTHGLKIAGTGTISISGSVGMIGGIKEKIPTAFDDHVDVFFCAKGNYKDAKEAYDSLPNHNMKLVEIETFYDALNYLKEGYKNDFGC